MSRRLLFISSKLPSGEKVPVKGADPEVIEVPASESKIVFVKGALPTEEVNINIIPSRGVDVGAGKGEPLESVIFGGVVGLIFDGRNRPITLSTDPSQRIDSLLSWSNAVDEYPKGDLF